MNINAGAGRMLVSTICSMVKSAGRIFVVMPTGDSSQEMYQRAREVLATDKDGKIVFVNTLKEATDLVTSDNDDVIALGGDGAHAVTAMIDFSKNRTHFISLSGRLGMPNSYGLGAGSIVTMGVTTDKSDLAIFKNTGIGNTFQGIKFNSGNTLTESKYSVIEAGEYAIYDNCEFYKSTHLDVTDAAEVANNGNSAQFLNCVFGSSANIIADNVIRPNMIVSGGIVSGKKLRDGIVSHCLFLSKAGGTEAVRIYGANATDVERMLLVENSFFLNNILSAATPAHAVGFGAAQTQGVVILKNCTSVDNTVMAQAAVGIYVDGAVPTFATTGVSKDS